MITCIARPINPNELSLLDGSENDNLIILGEDDAVLKIIPAPPDGWNHDTLENACNAQEFDYADAFLDTRWIGSTEV
ncbi:hypothetical protein ABT56_19210 [Photobacterium aquae]|uniref:Uncharacterized protein n=1 Tax=Photobacterium aquae TaxID=1195763 RepID=A0A0J1GUY3_9GAMM|nr:hypothetical protein [Photobacterium aquae]KLV03558.1 hypothetical protein ABT56_19210 [Photobacterium aquae]